MESWRLDYDGWSETWLRDDATGGGFDRVVVGSRSFVISRDDLTALRPHTGQGCAECRGALPNAFRHCFACGAPLQVAVAADEPCQSAPNAGRPEAKLPPLTLADRAARPERLALPSVGRQFGFAIAGLPARLFAIDRDGGWLHEFDRRHATWARLFRVGENRLPERSWSAAAAAGGIVVPAEGQLTVVDLTRGPLPQQVATALAPGDVCIGGACILQNEAMVPIMRAGGLHLARRQMLRDAAWSFEAVPGATPLSASWSDDAAMLPWLALSAPMATEVSVSWAGEQGYVVATLGDDGTAGAPLWRGWSGGFVPRLEHRPYADPDGSVWQFGSAPQAGGRKSLGFERMAASQTGHHTVSGSVLASGVLACRLLTLRHRAWIENSPYNHELPGRGEDDFLVPVQALDMDRSVLLIASDQLTALVNAGPDGIEHPALAGLRLWDGQALHDLAVPVSLRSLTQVAAFVFDRRLYVYDAVENECSRWQLRPAS